MPGQLDETLFRQKALARAVRDELAAVGLPVVPDTEMMSGELAVGATVDLDTAGGVYVSWKVHYVLSAAAAAAIEHPQPDPDGEIDPAIRLSGTAEMVILDAIAEILTTAGYDVLRGTNDMAPSDLRVSGWRGKSGWRDWSDAHR